ncbi:MAG TPA: hypothetical protein VMU51_30725 [Mycobacteriales bacterium]|nr:hypothetical protein [Mycobacteriales bacterium]
MTALVVVPLLAERVALGRRVPALRVGAGPRRAAAAAGRIRSELDSGRYAGLLITGTCGGLMTGMHPGDLVVASEVDCTPGLARSDLARSDLAGSDLAGSDLARSDLTGSAPGGRVPAARPVRCVEPEQLVEELTEVLRRYGHMVHIGRMYTADHLVDGPERATIAATGAIAVDTESAILAAAAGDRPVVVIRAVSDTPAQPLRSVRIVRNGLSALRSLHAAAPVVRNLSVPANKLGADEAEREVG